MFGLFLFVYSHFRTFLRAGDYVALLERLNSLDFIVYSLMYSEPFITQSILNEVVEKDFTSPLYQLVSFILVPVPFTTMFFNVDGLQFFGHYQEVLFGKLTGIGTLANNYWAQLWSMGGYSLLIIYLFIHNLVLFILNKVKFMNSLIINAYFIPFMIYGTFYLNRK